MTDAATSSPSSVRRRALTPRRVRFGVRVSATTTAGSLLAPSRAPGEGSGQCRAGPARRFTQVAGGAGRAGWRLRTRNPGGLAPR